MLRIILVIPHAIVLAILGLIGFMLVIIAGFMILVRERYPAGIYNFLVGITRWNARVYAYLASLVAEYPPFSLDTGSQRAVLDARAPTQTRE